MGREHSRWEATLITSPHDIVSVPEKSQFTPIIKNNNVIAAGPEFPRTLQGLAHMNLHRGQ